MFIREELNKKIDYDRFSNIMTETASSINKKNKEENAFELENFLYNESAYPTINLGKVVNEKDILNNNFRKEEVFIENVKADCYVYNEDNNIIIYEDPNTENILLQYSHNFSKIKDILNPNMVSEKIDSNINSLLEKSDTYYGSEASILTESSSFILKTKKDESLIYDNPFLNAYAVKLLNEKYEDISKSNSGCELILTEECIDGVKRPIVSSFNPIEEKIENVMQVGFKKSFTNHYSIVIK